MTNYKSSSLFHYTKGLEQIKRILRYGFEPRYCIEKYPRTSFSKDKVVTVIGIPMVCFCDIPLSCVRKHSKQYGKFAIALSKKWAIKNRVNPVFYIYNKSIIEDIFGLQHDATSEKTMFACWYNDDIARNNLLGHTKIAQDSSRDFYRENEWRYILKPKVPSASVHSMGSRTYKWLYDEEAMLLEGKDAFVRRNYKRYLSGSYLKFEINDIQHIIVPTESEVVLCCNELKRLQSVCGKNVTKDERTILFSKIISLERVNKDF